MIARRPDMGGRGTGSVRRQRREGDPGTWLLALIVPLMILGGWLTQFI